MRALLCEPNFLSAPSYLGREEEFTRYARMVCAKRE